MTPYPLKHNCYPLKTSMESDHLSTTATFRLFHYSSIITSQSLKISLILNEDNISGEVGGCILVKNTSSNVVLQRLI